MPTAVRVIACELGSKLNKAVKELMLRVIMPFFVRVQSEIFDKLDAAERKEGISHFLVKTNSCATRPI